MRGQQNRPNPLEIVKQIVANEPAQESGEVVNKSMLQGLAKHQAEDALHDPAYVVTKGKGRSKLYSRREPLEIPTPDFPVLACRDSTAASSNTRR